MRRCGASILVALGSLTTLGCRPPADDSLPFEEELLRAAKEYKAWGRVDDEVRFAPELCRMPNPGIARFSASEDADTHGQKLYSLFARHRKEYVTADKTKPVTVGQVIVKESWVPEEVKDMKPVRPGFVAAEFRHGKPDDDHFYPYAAKGDKVYKAGQPAGLFIMKKLDPKTPGTDDGWVYGTVSADAKTVTAAGKVESCMKCHTDAKHDRLFGLPVHE
jgi:Cytochrome P460